MKHKVLAFILATVALLAACRPGVASAADERTAEVGKKEVKALLREFKGSRGYECSEVGPFLLSIMKTGMKYFDDDDDDADNRLIMKSVKNLKGVTVADLSDCSPEVKAKFNSRMEEVFRNASLLIETKDDDETVRIYGKTSADGRYVEDVVIYCPDDAELTYLEGKIDIDALMEYSSEVR